MKRKLTIFKIGGRVLEDEQALGAFLKAFSAWPELKLLVHGGGKKATQITEQLGFTPRMIEGRRITDEPALEVALMVYGGLYNKKIVALLQGLGVNAVGLSGADAGLILAQKRPAQTIDYGLVGDVVKIDSRRVHWFLEADLTPVFCALTHDGRGQMLNTNADTIATQLAISMSAVFPTELIFCFEKPGVLAQAQDESSVIWQLNAALYEQYRQQKVITDGMIPKLDNAFDALRKGVQKVRITHFNQLKKGTHITLE
ncbi:acetylglutamate kinase [Calditrichota bacterium LG25]